MASGLGGLLWLHADTDAGTNPDFGTGVHGHQLANSHTPMDPETPWAGTGGHWIQVPALSFLLWPRDWREPIVNPMDWLGRFETPLLVSDGVGGLGVMTHGGRFVELRDRFGSSLAASLAASTRWVAPAEPQTAVGLQNPIAGLVLSPDGNRIIDTMRLSADGSRLLGAADVDVPNVDILAPTDGWQPLLQSSSAVVPARNDFTAVYSRQLNRLFILGGNDPVGTVLHDIWVVSPLAGVRELSTTIELARVAAATYSYPDRSLYVLDELKNGHGHHARLLRVDAMKGTTTVIGRWPTLRFQQRQWLVADREGGILVVGIRKAWPKATTMVRIDVKTAQVTNVVTDSRTLAIPPVVDRAGYGLLWENRHDGGVTYERRANLGGVPGRLTDIGRCF